MNIQIGLNCEPLWLCTSIEWAIGIVVLVVLVLFIRRLYREWKKLQSKNDDER